MLEDQLQKVSPPILYAADTSYIQGANFIKLLLFWRVDKHQCRRQWIFSCLLVSVMAYIQSSFRCFDEHNMPLMSSFYVQLECFPVQKREI